MSVKIQHHDCSIDEIINFFVLGFDAGEGRRIINHEYNIDQHNGRVWLKLYIDEPDVKVTDADAPRTE